MLKDYHEFAVITSYAADEIFNRWNEKREANAHNDFIIFSTTQFVADALRIFAFNSNLTIITSWKQWQQFKTASTFFCRGWKICCVEIAEKLHSQSIFYWFHGSMIQKFTEI